ncbi:MAG: sodium:calcium antiporter [Candidatus Nealsonbacteria bacterium]
MISYYIPIFIISCLILFWSGSRLVKSLMKIAKFLGWKKFVVAFFVMAIAGSLPNLFVGINAALRGIPELAFGEIVGGNIIDLTLAIALVILIGGVNLPARTKIVQTSVIFTVLIAILPLVLIFDGLLSRGDGFILFFTFLVYVYWLFSREERFKKIYNNKKGNGEKSINIKDFFKDFFQIIFFLGLLLLASDGIVRSAGVFAESFNLTIPMVGILIIGIGNALPEMYFAIISAKRKQTEMILGDLMGSVIVCATLVLGIVALISPIRIIDFSPFVIGRFFLIFSALFFFIFVKTDRKITKKEGLFLFIIYVTFLFSEIYLKDMLF